MALDNAGHYLKANNYFSAAIMTNEVMKKV